MNTILSWYDTITDIAFWLEFIQGFKDLGPLAPIFLALLESIIPALPLIVIVSFNVTAYGLGLGFVYSWLGSFIGSTMMFLFYRKGFHAWFARLSSNKKGISKIVVSVNKHVGNVLFVLTSLPFTPNFLINLVYGLSNIDTKYFIVTIFFSKLLMIGSMALFGHSLTQITDNPVYLLLSILGMFILYLISKKMADKYLEHPEQ